MPINVKDAAGATVSIETPNANGRQAAAGSRPVALSTEDKAAIDAITAAIIAAVHYPATQPVSATSLPLPTNAATSALQTALNTAVGLLLTENTFTTRVPTLGTKAASGSVSVTPSNDQDPVFDHATGVKATVTTASATAITPPAGAKYMWVQASADTFIRTDGVAAADAAGSILLMADREYTIPVVGGTAVTAVVVSGTATLRATPMKVR